MIRLASLSILFLSFSVWAEEPSGTGKKPLWELGVGSALVLGPDYPAADESRTNGLALPYFAYRGKFLRVDREEGLRAMFAEKKKWEFDLSAGGSFPANSKDNEARQGMNDLSWIGELGPQFSYYFIRSERQIFRLQIPYRFVMSTDFRTWVDRGENFSPSLRYTYRKFFDGNLIVGGRFGAWWASRRMNEYFYEVEPRFVRAERPQYGAKAGYVGKWVSASALWVATPKLWLFAGTAYTDYSGSANEDSPLFKSKSANTYSIGVIWSLWESKAREQSRYQSDLMP